MTNWKKYQVETTVDCQLEVSVLLGDGGPERVSVIGSSHARSSHEAVETGLERAGWQLLADLNHLSWEPGEVEGEEVVYLRTGDVEQLVTAVSLARQLYRDDLSRADEVPLERDGRKAYDGWVRASSDAGDRDTGNALAAVDADGFAAEWDRFAAKTHS